MARPAAPAAPTKDAVKAWDAAYSRLNADVDSWATRLSAGQLPLKAGEQARLNSLTTAIQSLTPMPTGNAQVIAAISEGSLAASKASLDASMDALPRHVVGSAMDASKAFGWTAVSDPVVAAGIVNGSVGQMTADWTKLNVQIQNSLRTELATGAALGKGSVKTAANIRSALDTQMSLGQYRSVMISRTVLAAAYDQATASTYIAASKDGLIFGWEWSAQVASYRTCRICLELNGKIFPAAEPTYRHPNCRCSMVPVLTDTINPKKPPEFFQGSDEISLVTGKSGWTTWTAKAKGSAKPKPKPKPKVPAGGDALQSKIAEGQARLAGRRVGDTVENAAYEEFREKGMQGFRDVNASVRRETFTINQRLEKYTTGKATSNYKPATDYDRLKALKEVAEDNVAQKIAFKKANPKKRVWDSELMDADLKMIEETGAAAREIVSKAATDYVAKNPIENLNAPLNAWLEKNPFYRGEEYVKFAGELVDNVGGVDNLLMALGQTGADNAARMRSVSKYIKQIPEGQDWLDGIENARAVAARKIVADARGVDKTAKVGVKSTAAEKKARMLPKGYQPMAEEWMPQINDAFQLYPKKWTDAFSKHNPDLTVSRATRASYSESTQSLSLSWDAAKTVKVRGDRSGRRPVSAQINSVATHEIGHGMERSIPGLLDLEHAYWRKRVKGSVTNDTEIKHKRQDKAWVATKIEDPTPNWYTLKRYFLGGEDVKTDKGWDYIDPQGNVAYEIFTTGVQNVLGDGGMEFLDASLFDFTMGSLLLL